MIILSHLQSQLCCHNAKFYTRRPYRHFSCSMCLASRVLDAEIRPQVCLSRTLSTRKDGPAPGCPATLLTIGFCKAVWKRKKQMSPRSFYALFVEKGLNASTQLVSFTDTGIPHMWFSLRFLSSFYPVKRCFL